MCEACVAWTICIAFGMGMLLGIAICITDRRWLVGTMFVKWWDDQHGKKD